MANRKKREITDDGPVKIVGINHGLCLAYTLFLEGWKREGFADVTFYCKPSSKETNGRGSSKKKLRANRSVLAASSPFFSAMLPDCELENDVCITTELLYDEMFSVLEYIYSGKLLCPAESKESFVKILKDFKIFIPDSLEESNNKSVSEIEIFLEELPNEISMTLDEGNQTKMKDVMITNQNSLNVDEELNSESNIFTTKGKSSVNFFKIRSYSNKNRKISNNVAEKENNNQKFKVSSSASEVSADHVNYMEGALILASRSKDNVVQSSQVVIENEKPGNNHVVGYEDESINSGLVSKEAVTIPVPSFLLNSSRLSPNFELEKHVLEAATKNIFTSRYSLPLYLTYTWGCGIYSKPENEIETKAYEFAHDKNCPQRKSQTTFIHNWTSYRQPTFLTSRPQKVYSKGSLQLRRSKDQEKAVLRLKDIQNMKHFNGKIHVTLNGEPMTEKSLPQLFHGGGDYDGEQEESVDGSAVTISKEADDEQIDCALAKHFIQEEMRKKQKLQLRLRMLSERLEQYKSIGKAILMKKKEMEIKGLFDGTYKYPAAKKSCSQVQCEQCGKMILASRLSIHLKTHNGVKSHLCDLCGRAFLLKAYLNAHIRINHRGINRPKRFMCSACGYTCDQRHKLEVHERVHTDERPFPCQYCDKKFREKGTLTRHIRTHTGEKPYACSICGTAYAARDTYVQHYRRKHLPRPDGSTESRPRGKHSNVVIYRCEFCQKGFYRVLAYEKHRATHTGVAAAVPCSQPNCNFTYSDMTQLKDHMALCHPDKIYTCGVCNKVFLTKQNLVNHQAKHDPNLGYHCSYCSLSLTTKASLLQHEKIHTRERPYVCHYCGMSFHSPYLMKIHVRKHQPNQPLPKRKRSKRGSDETQTVTYY